MKYLIKVLVIIGLVSISHVAIAIDNVDDGDLLTAEGMNEVIDAVNPSKRISGLVSISLPRSALVTPCMRLAIQARREREAWYFLSLQMDATDWRLRQMTRVSLTYGDVLMKR